MQKRNWKGATAHLVLSHDTMFCIVTCRGTRPRHGRAVHARARDRRRDTVGWATIQPTTRPARAQGRAASALGPGCLGDWVVIQMSVS